MIAMFFTKKIEYNDYSDVQKRLITLESKYNGLVLDMEELRNKVLRKLQERRIKEEETEIKPGMILPTANIK